MNAPATRKYIDVGSLAVAIIFLPYSMSLCHLGLVIFIINWITQGQWSHKIALLHQHSILLLFALFFLLHVIGAFYSEDTANGWFNVEKKISLILVPLALATCKPMEKKEIRLLLNLFIATCLMATIICLGNAVYQFSRSTEALTLNSLTSAQFYDGSPGAGNPWLFFSYIQLAYPIRMHPTYLSMYLAFCTLILIHLHGSSFYNYSIRKRTLLLTLFIFLSLCIICLSSRIVTLVFLGITLYGTVQVSHPKYSRALKWVYSLTSIGVLFFLIYLFPVSRYRNIQEVTSTPISFNKPGLQTQSTGIRASLWWLGLQSMHNVNPLWGAGPGDVQRLMKEAGEKNNIQNVMGTNDPHDQYLQTYLGLGLLGLITLILCFAVPATLAWRQSDYFYLGFISLFTIVCLTESVLEQQKGIVFFAIFNSLLIFQYGNFQFGLAQVSHR